MLFGLGACAVPGAVAAVPTLAVPAFPITAYAERFDADGLIGDRWVVRRSRGDPPIDLIVLILPQARYATSIAPVARADLAPRLFPPLPCRAAAVVTNGGFFWRSIKGPRALGLVRVSGRTLTRPSGRRYGGFLTATDGTFAVLRRQAANTALRATDAIESSPIIVWNARSDMKSDDGIRFDRVALGTTVDGQLVIVGAFAPDQETVTLTELGALAMAAVRLRQKRLDTLIALDGGPSAHLYLARQRRLFGFGGSMYLPNAVCVTRR